MKESKLYDGETVLADDCPVYGDYLYVSDGMVVRSDVFGTVATLRDDLRRHYKMPALEIRRCNIEARRAACAKAEGTVIP